jgi:anhydro-N-acetylmuramic acid kinase
MMYLGGLMSGTSLDGMDAAMLFFDENGDLGPAGQIYDNFATCAIEYTGQERKALERAVQDALDWQFKGPAPKSFQKASEIVYWAGYRAMNEVREQTGLVVSDLMAVGFHGQTLLHRPPRDGVPGQTLQVGDAQALADRLSTFVAYDFRSADMGKGGHGAPLAPAWHFELAKKRGKTPTAFVNIGGVSNITFIPDLSKGSEARMIAFDCGPGNGPLDAWVQSHGLGNMDRDGTLSAKGRVHPQIVANVVASLPEVGVAGSLDRWAFDPACVSGLSVEDGAATLLEITAQGIWRGILALQQKPVEILVGGGGLRNPVLMARLNALSGNRFLSCEAIAFDSDFVEAHAFAWLAGLRLLDKPGSWPGTTGAREPVVCGSICAPCGGF